MSHSFYNKQWTDAQAALHDLLWQEHPPDPPKPEKDRVAVFQMLATMFIKYVQIFRRLEQCYDQIVHPQKRRVLRHVLDGTMGRILELKQEMVDLEFSEFHYFDDVLSDLKLTPDDIDMPIPKYFLKEREKALKEREKLLNHILTRMGNQDKEVQKEEVKISEEDAIRMIQKHERARQGRLRAKFMREIRQQEERERIAANRGAPTLDPDVAATRIIKLWKGYAQRRRTKEEREAEMMFIGMAPPPVQGNAKMAPQALATKTEDERRVKQTQHEQEYQTALVTIKDKVRENEGPDMRERLQDMIRQWFIEFKDHTGKLPEFPDEDDGGSKLIFSEKTPEQLQAELSGANDDKKGKGKDKKDKKKEKEKKGKDKDKKGKKGKEEEEDEGWKMKPSVFVPAIDEATVTFKSVWAPREENDNFMQKHDAELIREEKRKEVEEEVRIQVDELMREELKNLKLALEKDKGKKKKKSGKKKKKKKSGKKGKKGKKEKDLTPDRSIEDLYQELVQEGIIQRAPRVSLSDFEGEYSYLGTTLRQANIEPQPSLSDVRRLVCEFAILPMGSPAVHESAPLIRSILLAGPKGTGKKMLIHAICTEIGANLFNLTAKNIEGKYPGKDGLKMLLHMVFKVGRALQPSVIFIDEAEKMFKKKIPKTDLTDPKRLKKDLPKVLKTIKPEDRLILVGTTYLPWDAEVKPLEGCYQKILLVPRPDYASRHMLWRSLIKKHGGQIKDVFDVSSLAKITDGYTPGQIAQCCQQVLSERRINQLSKKALLASEFIASLARQDPVYKEEEDMFKEWYNNKTKLGKKRKKAAEGEGEEDAKAKGGKGAKGKKGKKK